MKAWMSLNFRKIPPQITESSEKSMYNVVNTLAPLFLIESSSFMQVRRTTIIFRTSSKFGMIRPHTAELAALECLKKFPYSYNGENLVNILEPFF